MGMKELVIIGAGPAGISAALYAKRANIDVKVIYMDKSSLNMAHLIENYYGIDTISGEELFKKGIKQAQRLDIPMIEDEVLSLNFSDRFEVIGKKDTYKADAMILALGAYRNIPSVKGIKDLEGKGVSYCATCDGFFYRKKKVAVLGNSSYAYHEAEYLKNLTDDLMIFTNGLKVEDEKLNDFMVYTNKILSVNGQDKIESITLDDGNTITLDGLFIALGSAGSADLARKIGILVDAQNKIITDENMRTNIPGIYAAGDDTKGMLQVAKAVYEGALAATDVISYFKTK